MREEVICYRCGGQAEKATAYRCSLCGGPLIVSYDTYFDVSKIKRSLHSMWRYINFLPPSLSKPVSLGEGLTPITKIYDRQIYVKHEYMNPTGSFKDRGSSTLISRLRGLVEGLVCDSSGNAGASIAAYSAYAGLGCVIYSTSSGARNKMAQIAAYGSSLKIVEGGREQAMSEALQASDGVGYHYAGHAWSPYFIEGVRTIAYEIGEQFGWSLPDRIYIPTSAGTLLLGIILGLKTLRSSGLLDKFPEIIAVQPKAISPLYNRYKNVGEPSYTASIADALSHTNPPRLEQMVRELKIVGGDVVVVSDEEIRRAQRELAFSGIYVEPSAAVGYAAIRRELDEIIASDVRVLTLATGTGLKTADKTE
ncbi:MAG: pyridoxal-phosphate dependent enzyme [Nitrososphaerota archaeon]